MARACARFGKLHNVWHSGQLELSLKLLLYKHAVVSTLVHAHEAWKLTPGVMKMLNGWNSRCVSVLTGRDIAKEAGRRQTFDLVSHLRVSRLRWVGHVLRMDDSRYLKQALLATFEANRPGSSQTKSSGCLLMDAPKCSSVSELVTLAGVHGDHAEWDRLVHALSKRVMRTRAARQ